MPLAVGTVLGQYEIRSPLGAGGMGEVYRAHDRRLDREVAIKVLPEPLTSDPDRLRRFEQEARAAAALNHPNILVVYQMATQDGISYLVSELLEGETLRERLRHGPLALRKAIDYEAQVAHGLAAAHDKGIIHRDLKPENLFITKDGRVKILDFGLAKLTQIKDPDLTDTMTQGTDPGIVAGTVGYMSPEQVRGKAADHRSDIFAFGTILYESVTGKQTFRKATSAETMTAILNEEPPAVSQFAPSVPPGLQRVVHRCLEKVPDQRFQSASDLAFALEALSDSSIISASGPYAIASAKTNRLHVGVIAAATVIVLGAALAYFLARPPGSPKVSNYVQLTHDGQPKRLGATDGSRLFLYLSGSDYKGMAEMLVSGGEARKLPILNSGEITPRSLSSDQSELLAVEGQGVPPKGPLWSVSILGGSPRRIGDLIAVDASWSPDGKLLAYSNGSELFVAKADGTESRKLPVQTHDILTNMVWSPDATRLRFTEQNFNAGYSSIWEISVDGTDLHQLFPGWHNPPDDLGGSWSADGNYFLFSSQGQIWTLPRKAGWFRAAAKPIQLTASPMALVNPIPSKDGKKLFVVGATTRGELMRYDAKSAQFVPFLGGISAEYTSFSRDGKWVAYVSYPDGALWRSKVDGSESLQLTHSPNYALLPRWSPDGKDIVFFENLIGKPTKIYTVSAEGGTPRPLLPDYPQTQQDPNWSPDGKKMVFAGNPNDASSAIHILDLATGQISTLPGSQGFYSPRWSPDGRYIPALSMDSKTLLVFDFQTQKWSEVLKGTIAWLNWSRDGRYLIVLYGNTATTLNRVVRIRLSDYKTEKILDVENFVLTGHFGSSLSLAPDDSPLLLRNAGTYDVYALDWEAP